MSRAKRKKRKKEFISTWAFEPFDRDPTFCTKPMFGCLAAYVRGRMVMVLTEDPGDQSYRGKKYSFDIWNGILLPTERDCHESLIKEFGALAPHPVLGKWLYLPAEDENFETLAREIGDLIAQGDPRFGIDLKIKLPKPRMSGPGMPACRRGRPACPLRRSFSEASRRGRPGP